MPSFNTLRNVNLTVSTDGRGVQRGVPEYADILWSFTEDRQEAELVIKKDGRIMVDVTDPSTGTFKALQKSSISSSITSPGPNATLGSFSMSLSISGSDYFNQQTTRDLNAGLFNEFTASRNVEYTISSSIGYDTGCPTPWLTPTASCGANTLPYTFSSLDVENNRWLPADINGNPTPTTGSYGNITGSASVINVNQDGCNFPGVLFSGSATFPLSAISVYLAVVTGSFTLCSSKNYQTDLYGWKISSTYANTGSVEIQFYTEGGGGPSDFDEDNATNKNALVGMILGTGVGPFDRRDVTYYVSGSAISTNPPVTSIAFPLSLGSEFTLFGEGVIGSFGPGTGSVSQQTQYTCMYGGEPTK